MSAKTAFAGWAAIGYESLYSEGGDSPSLNCFVENYRRNYSTKTRRAVAPNMERAWFWFRVGFRHAARFERTNGVSKR